MSWDVEDEEVERELEEARSADRSRSRAPATMGQIIAKPSSVLAVAHVEKLLECTQCGFASSSHRGWRVHPFASGLLCAGRHDETGAPVDCFDKADRELQRRNDALVDETKRVIGDAVGRGELTDAYARFLRTIPSGQDSIDALKKRFDRARNSGPRSGHRP